MKNLSSAGIAVLTGILSAIIAGILLLLPGSFTLADILKTGIAVFFAASLAGYLTINKLVYHKIKNIYKTLLQLKPNKEGALNRQPKERHLLNTLNQEVLDWAKNKKEEIESLRSIENYRKEFIGNVSHELKTPIFNIQGYISTLLEGGLEDPRINRDYLVRAEKSVDRMITIIEDLETITRFESGQLNLEVETFDIVQLAKEVMEQEERMARNKNIKVRFSKNYEKPVKIKADKERIRQVLTNLIVNSLKYGNSGGYTEIGFHDKGESILIDIADNGLGIAEHHLSRLFERFYRVDKSRSREQGGSGLGLAIVKHIVEAHGETISVKSSPGVGSVFSFTLKKA